MKAYPCIVRSCKCPNGHVWQNPVVFIEPLQKEADPICPICRQEESASSCWRIQISERFVLEMVTSNVLGSNPPPFGK